MAVQSKSALAGALGTGNNRTESNNRLTFIKFLTRPPSIVDSLGGFGAFLKRFFFCVCVPIFLGVRARAGIYCTKGNKHKVLSDCFKFTKVIPP